MKTTIKRNAIQVTLLAATLLATCSFARPVNAQSVFQGNFTLPYEVRWGKAVLPPGDYQLLLTNNQTVLVIRDAKTYRHVAFEPINIRASSTSGNSALLIGARGKQRVVHSVRIAELGEVFIYDPALARARGVEEARTTSPIPVLLAQQ
jgi:hypothetical protein